MKVFKFGGASINSIERIYNVAAIIRSYEGDKIFIIISHEPINNINFSKKYKISNGELYVLQHEVNQLY